MTTLSAGSVTGAANDSRKSVAAFAGGAHFWTLALAAIAITFFAAYWLTFPRELGERPVFNSPRESIGYYLTERFLDGSNFSAPLLHYDELPPDIAIALTPRDAASVDGNVVPRDFAGTLLLHAAVMFVHPAIALALGPLFALLGAWALMRTAQHLFGDVAGRVAFVCWLAFPPLWMNASFIFSSDMPALAFLLLAVMVFARYWHRPTTRDAALMALLFSASVLFRYPNVLIGVPFAAALLFTGRVSIRHAALTALIALPFALTVLAFNYYVYGDPFTTGFHLGAQLIDETVNYSKESFLKYRPEVLWHYLRTYAMLPVIAVPIALSLIATFAAVIKTRGSSRAIAVIALVVFGILLSYYGQQDAWGYKSPQASASILRYLLPAFALILLFGSWAVAVAIERWGKMMILVPGAFITASALWIVSAPGGAESIHSIVDRSTVLQSQVLANTDQEDVVAVRIMDKVIFPERQTLTLTYAIQNEEPFPKGSLETWDYVAPPERFADIGDHMNEAGISLYLLHDGRIGDIAPYQDALNERGLYLRLIPEVTVATFYKVSRVGREE